MAEIDIASLTWQVLGATFVLAFGFGWLAQRTHFCTMGAIADVVNMGDWARLRMWVLAMGVAVLGFNTMAALGWVDAADSLYAAPRLLWLSHLVGGLLFGFGMVLASGCGSKTLIRVGGGNLKSLVVLVVLGVAGFMTLKGLTAVIRVSTVDRVALTLPTGQDLPSLLAGPLGQSRPVMAAVLGLLIGGALVAWAVARDEGRRAEVLLGGLGVGLVIVGAWWVSGRLGHVAEHPETLARAFLATNSQRMEAFSFVAPVAFTLDWLMFFSDQSKTLTMGIVSVGGVIAGSALCAVTSGSFRWEGFGSVEDVANHLVGAVLMGVGGVTAVGCTIGQGLSGVSTLALGSVIALAGIVLGAVGALRWQLSRL